MTQKKLIALLAVSILVMTAQAVFAEGVLDVGEGISLWVILRTVLGAAAGFLAGGLFGAVIGAVFMFFVNPCGNVPNLPIVY